MSRIAVVCVTTPATDTIEQSCSRCSGAVWASPATLRAVLRSYPTIVLVCVPCAVNVPAVPDAPITPEQLASIRQRLEGK